MVVVRQAKPIFIWLAEHHLNPEGLGSCSAPKSCRSSSSRGLTGGAPRNCHVEPAAAAKHLGQGVPSATPDSSLESE